MSGWYMWEVYCVYNILSYTGMHSLVLATISTWKDIWQLVRTDEINETWNNIFNTGMLPVQWQSSLSHSNLWFHPVCIAQSCDQISPCTSIMLKEKVDILWQWLTEPSINPLKPKLNPICYLLALLGAHHFLHVSRIRVKLLTFRRLIS